MKVSFVLLLSLYFVCQVKGQVLPDSLNEKYIREILIKPAEYIFEGTVLETKSNYLAKNGRWVGQGIIQIHKDFKGNLKAGTIEILVCPTGPFYDKDQNKWIELEVSDGQCLGLEIGRTYLFFSTKSNKELSVTDCPVTNKILVQELDRSEFTLDPKVFHYENEAYISGGQTYKGKAFKKLQDLYVFILESPGTKLIDFDHKTFVKLGRYGKPLNN